MKKIYVCSPYSGDIGKNTENAREYCRAVVDNGHIPIAPHLLFPQFMDEDTERAKAFKMNFELLKMCDEVWVFGDITSGMLKEIERAYELNIPVFKNCMAGRFVDGQTWDEMPKMEGAQ